MVEDVKFAYKPSISVNTLLMSHCHPRLCPCAALAGGRTIYSKRYAYVAHHFIFPCTHLKFLVKSNSDFATLHQIVDLHLMKRGTVEFHPAGWEPVGIAYPALAPVAPGIPYAGGIDDVEQSGVWYVQTCLIA